MNHLTFIHYILYKSHHYYKPKTFTNFNYKNRTKFTLKSKERNPSKTYKLLPIYIKYILYQFIFMFQLSIHQKVQKKTIYKILVVITRNKYNK